MSQRPTIAAQNPALASSEHPETSAFALTPSEVLQRVRGDLRSGLPIIVDTNQSSLLVALVDHLTPARYEAMRVQGDVDLVITRERGQAAGITWPQGSESLAITLNASTDFRSVQAIAGTQALPVGLTEKTYSKRASSAHDTMLMLAQQIQAIPALLCVPLSREHGLSHLFSVDLSALQATLNVRQHHAAVSTAALPMSVSEQGRVHVFRPNADGPEHFAIEVGHPDMTAPVLVRLHSACFTGDVLGSLKCDCGPQLRSAMTTMANGDGGLLLYLNQEGRGIGMTNKMRAYNLQSEGLDTVEANHWLGFKDDQRDFRVAADMLKSLGISTVRLLTNNPKKIDILSAHGIEVLERLPLRVGDTPHNTDYLATKAAKSGHLL